MKEIFPIGTIVHHNMGNLMMVGYTFRSEERDVIKQYICTFYPAGYRGDGSLTTVDIDSVSVLQKGFETTESKILSFYLDSISKLAAGCSKEAVAEAIKNLEREVTL